MPANVEIKARARDFDRQRGLAEAMADGPVQVLNQEDVFYQSPRGRLKLRIFDERRGELIFYRRPDQVGPKTSEYYIHPTDRPGSLRQVLDLSLPQVGVVRKRRDVFLVGQTRLHFDQVEGLGRFLELEVVLRPGQAIAEGECVANELMARLEIERGDLIDTAYIDLINR